MPYSHTTESLNVASAVLVLFSIPDQPVGHGNVLLSVTPTSTELA